MDANNFFKQGGGFKPFLELHVTTCTPSARKESGGNLWSRKITTEETYDWRRGV